LSLKAPQEQDATKEVVMGSPVRCEVNAMQMAGHCSLYLNR
jgi:hypothetical protein